MGGSCFTGVRNHYDISVQQINHYTAGIHSLIFWKLFLTFKILTSASIELSLKLTTKEKNRNSAKYFRPPSSPSVVSGLENRLNISNMQN